MKYTNKLLLFCLILLSQLSFSQDDAKQLIQKTIEDFFEAFESNDSTAVKSHATEQMRFQFFELKNGQHKLRSMSIANFIEFVMDDQIIFEEDLHSFDIAIDDLMAHAWVPYTFKTGGKAVFCGVNSIQLAKIDGVWKIIYLMDTRRKEGC